MIAKTHSPDMDMASVGRLTIRVLKIASVVPPHADGTVELRPPFVMQQFLHHRACVVMIVRRVCRVAIWQRRAAVQFHGGAGPNVGGLAATNGVCTHLVTEEGPVGCSFGRLLEGA
jgi:hypothetical protein